MELSPLFKAALTRGAEFDWNWELEGRDPALIESAPGVTDVRPRKELDVGRRVQIYYAATRVPSPAPRLASNAPCGPVPRARHRNTEAREGGREEALRGSGVVWGGRARRPCSRRCRRSGRSADQDAPAAAGSKVLGRVGGGGKCGGGGGRGAWGGLKVFRVSTCSDVNLMLMLRYPRSAKRRFSWESYSFLIAASM